MASRLQQIITPEKPIIPATTTGSRLNLLLGKEVLPMKKETFLERTFPSAKEILEEFKMDPLSLRENPKEAISSAWNSLKESVAQSAPKISKLFTEEKAKEISSKELGKELEAVSAFGHIVFAPISALFEGMNKVPVLGSVSRLISLPFVAGGEAASGISGEIVDELPIPDKDKENIKQGIQEISALATQLVIGKITHIGTKKVKELKTKFGEKDAQMIVNKAQEFAEQAKEPVPETVSAPTIAPEAQKGVAGALKAEKGIIPTKGIKEVGAERKFVEVPREQLPVRMEGAEKGVSALEARMKGIFETENVKRAKAEAEARGLDISIYDKMSKPEQINAAAKYVAKTAQKEILEVLEGKREAPKGLLHNAIMLALEEKSLRDKNVDLSIKLASLRSTRAGQEISILTEVGEISPVSGMDVIIRARREVATKKLGEGKTIQGEKVARVKDIKTEQTKLQMKMSEVEKLLSNIVC